MGWKSKSLHNKYVSVCGVRGTKGPKQRPSVDPELALLDLPADNPSRKQNNGRKNPTKRKRPGSKKPKKKKTAKANKKKNRSRNKNGLVKREAFSRESNPSRLKNGKKKQKRERNAGRTKGKKKKNRKRKKSRRKGELRQGESDGSDGSDIRTRQVWPWMVGPSCAISDQTSLIIDHQI